MGMASTVAITRSGRAKDTALDNLVQQLSPTGMTSDNCIAFGDGTDDIAMLAWAGVGVSMENAETEAVIAAADLVTVTNDAHGVAEVLERMLAEAASVDQFRRQVLGLEVEEPAGEVDILAGMGLSAEHRPRQHEEAVATAAKVQAMHRGKLARRERQQQTEAATKMQAVQRGKAVRKAAETPV